MKIGSVVFPQKYVPEKVITKSPPPPQPLNWATIIHRNGTFKTST